MASIKTLAVYLGSSGRCREIFQQSALSFGAMIGAQNMNLVYGGMDSGLMGKVARGAMSTGAHVTGIIPRTLKDIERELEGLSETIIVEDLWDRKKRMFQRADAIVALPGGYGTLDEVMETFYWANLGLHGKPVVLVNIENYFDLLIHYLHTLPDFKRDYLIVASKMEDVFPALAAWQPPHPFKESDRYPHFEDEITRKTEDSIIIDKASVENTYYAACALGLKQLGKHYRPIGFLNTGGQFNKLLDWFVLAEKEKFLTDKCLKLYSVSDNKEKLVEMLKNQEDVLIDLHREKWGERREKPRG